MKVMPSIREIAKEVRISFRDIGVILNKVGGKKTQGSKEVIKQQDNNNDANKNQQQQQQQQQQQHLSLSTPQAYKPFSNRKTLLEVAIELDLSESEATISIRSIES